MHYRQQLTLVIGDTLAFIISYCIMALVRFDVGAQGEKIVSQLALFSGLFALWVLIFFVFNLYDLKRANPTPRTIGLLIGAMLANTILAIVLFYFFASTVGISPKTNLAILIVSSTIVVCVWRRLFYILFSKTFARNIGIVGPTHPLVANLIAEINTNPQIGRVVGHWAAATDVDASKIDILIHESIDPKTLVSISEQFNTQTLSLADAYQSLFGKLPVELITEETALGIINAQKNNTATVLTRGVEIVAALVLLILSSPLLFIGIVLRLIEGGGPVFYSQIRSGKFNKPFRMYKLRSMVTTAEKDGAQWAAKNDARVTPVGAFLRKTHIDEIPQLFNILRGDLALIGPRPERPEFIAELEAEIPYYYLRQTVRPGFTGWAQIKFRYARTTLDAKEKFEYDLYYLKNKHILLDIGIFIKTVQIIFTH